jgi:regulator of protease activity HflC (stomatin/prohibitin superfamily)
MKENKLVGTLMVGAIILLAMLTMIATDTGFAIINDGERGIMKTGTRYDMEEMTPGYHFFIPVYQTIDVQTIRPKLLNYSFSEADKQDTELILFEPVMKGLDRKGVPIKLALSVEVEPVPEKLAEMYKLEGDFSNAFYKKVKQTNREAIQATISKFKVDTIMDNRGEVEKVLLAKLAKNYAENPYFKLVGVNLKDIIVPESIREKQLEVQSAKQDALKAKELIVKAKNMADAVAAKARGEAEKRKIEAQGKADAILLEAEARAKANKLVSQSLTPAILRNNAIEKWNGITPTMVGSETSQFIMDIKSK